MPEIQLKEIRPFTYEIPASTDQRMNVPGVVFASEKMMQALKSDQSLSQVVNVAMLPGIVRASYAMPDIHWGYGFPIGGVAAFDWQEGIVSPGGVGYDINCGVSLLQTNLTSDVVIPRIHQITDEIFRNVPSGIGSSTARYTDRDLEEILTGGLIWARDHGVATDEDIAHTEDGGSIASASPDAVSREARARGIKQIGTLGAGNHFLEIQRVDRIIDPQGSLKFGIREKDQVTVMIHTGSRGLGHQVATDFIGELNGSSPDIIRHPVDRQLNSAKIGTPLADRYIASMGAAANFGFVNRQVIISRVREAFRKFLPDSELKLVYSLAHNIAKIERHTVDGEERKLLVHRKGATRAFGPGNSNLTGIFRDTGHPVLVPGDMGSASYLLVGTVGNENLSFSSSCHGAGRLLSRTKSLKEFKSSEVLSKLEEKGIYLKAQSKQVISEEAPGSYKNIDDVIYSVEGADLTRTLARMTPMGVVKG